jgi:curved DNA-binding protein CbpA
MAAKNYFYLLRIPPTTSTSDITKAYRKLVKEFHPDLHGNKDWANEALKEINDAYERLLDLDFRNEHFTLLSRDAENRYGVYKEPELETDSFENSEPINVESLSLHLSLVNFTTDEIYKILIDKGIDSEYARKAALNAVVTRKAYVRTNAKWLFFGFFAVSIIFPTSIILFMDWARASVPTSNGIWTFFIVITLLMALSSFFAIILSIRYFFCLITGKNPTVNWLWDYFKIEQFVNK